MIVHSEFSSSELAETIQLLPDRVQQLGFSIDEEWFTPGLATSTLQQRLGLGTSRILLFVGRLANNKRLPTLISALPLLADHQPPFHVVAVGPSSECYEPERQYCRELAADLGVADRLHFLGSVDEATLRDCYRSADALVVPSLHEGFCLPVLEAMACGLPVIAARTTALPETVGEAGLCFNADDPSDLAAQVRRVFATQAKAGAHRIAVVTPAYGDATSGAERSLSMIAEQLRCDGQIVEVFTIRDESQNASARIFNADSADEERRAASLERCIAGDESSEPTYWQNTLRSRQLIQALIDSGPWDAIIVGPFANGLSPTWSVDLAHESSLHRVCMTSRRLDCPACATCSQPSAVCCTTAARSETSPTRRSALTIPTPRSSVRISRRRKPASQIVVASWLGPSDTWSPLVVAWRRRACRDCSTLPGNTQPSILVDFVSFSSARGRCRFPKNLGLSTSADSARSGRRACSLAQEALVNLSQNESLSLVVLKAQAIGVPVIVNAESTVMSGHVDRGRGGFCVNDYGEFARALNDLWHDPEASIELGRAGRSYVERHYGDPNALVRTVRQVIANLGRPMTDVMRDAGLQRAAECSRNAWRNAFERTIEYVTDQLSIYQPSRFELVASCPPNIGEWRVVLRNLEGAPLVPTGPARSEILLQVRDAAGDSIGKPQVIPLRNIVLAGQQASFRIPSPSLGREVSLEPGLRQFNSNGPPDVIWFGPHGSSERGSKNYR